MSESAQPDPRSLVCHCGEYVVKHPSDHSPVNVAPDPLWIPPTESVQPNIEPLPAEIQAALDEWEPDGKSDWQIAMWGAFEKVVRSQQAIITERDTTIERLEWANIFKLAGKAYRTCIDCSRQPGGGHASKCRIRDAAGVEAGIPTVLGETHDE